MASLTKYSCINFIAFIISMLFIDKSLAQNNYYEDSKRTFYGGLVGGFNFATIDNDDFTHYSKVGFNTGGIVYARFAEHIAGSMEILYSQKGRLSNTPVATGIGGVVFTRIYTNLNYVEVPVMINYFDRKKGILGVGLSYSRLLNSSEELSTDPPIYIDPSKYPFKPDDLELVIGGQIHLWDGLYLTIRFQFSTYEVRDRVPTDFYPTEQYNNLWVLRLMYLFK